MSDTPRSKYSTTSPARFSSALPENPRKEYNVAEARPSGRSGGGEPVSTPHRVSSSRRRARKSARA